MICNGCSRHQPEVAQLLERLLGILSGVTGERSEVRFLPSGPKRTFFTECPFSFSQLDFSPHVLTFCKQLFATRIGQAMSIQSMFDDDLYKFTMQQAVLKLYPDAQATYRFKNRGEQNLNGSKFISLLQKEIDNLGELRATDDELEKFSKLPFVEPWYVDYLKNYRYDTSQVVVSTEPDLRINITGPWHSSILWEVKLMASISKSYFELEKEEGLWSMDGQKDKLQRKTDILASGVCQYADFGTRRRRCYDIQDLVVQEFKKYHGFAGTSNVHLAFKHDLNPIGTMAHEWVQAISALESLNHANRVMLEKWCDVYGSDLGIALTDTFGTEAFFRDFDMRYAKLFDGVRHDSGDPFEFADKMVAHYKKLRINPGHKTIVFSDGLNAEMAVKIKKHCVELGINCSFGIGTAFTNDFATPALNIVVKLWSINDFNIAKLSDIAGKENGDPAAIQLYKMVYGRT